MKLYRTTLMGMVLVLGLVFFVGAGCEEEEAAKAKRAAEQAAATMPAAAAMADKMTEKLEDYTKKPLMTGKTAEKYEEVMDTVKKTSEGLHTLTKVVKVFVGKEQKPTLSILEQVLILLGGAVTVGGEYFRRQKNKAVEREEQAVEAAKTVMKAVDSEPGIGKKITAAAKKAGTSKEVEATYLDLVAAGDVG